VTQMRTLRSQEQQRTLPERLKSHAVHDQSHPSSNHINPCKIQRYHSLSRVTNNSPSLSHNSTIVKMRITGLAVFAIAQQTFGFQDGSMETIEDFKGLFKVTPSIAAKAWNLLERKGRKPRYGKVKHLLWTLYFMKCYQVEQVNKIFAGTTRKTFRKWTEIFIEALADLAENLVSFLTVRLSTQIYLTSFFQICFENRLINDNGSPVKLTVDGTDCRSPEYSPFDPGRLSHKFLAAGFRYEVAIAVATGLICSINGPFPCGSWPDLRIARNHLHRILPRGEYYFADAGYRSQYAPSVTKFDIGEHERDSMDRLMAYHENVNGKFKDWGILAGRWRSSEEKHGGAFFAVAVMTQLEIAEGMHVWH